MSASIAFCTVFIANAFSQATVESPELEQPSVETSKSRAEISPREKLRRELSRLQAICDRLNLAHESEACRNWLQVQRPDQDRLYLPSDFPQSKDQTESARWRDYFVQARKNYAASLYDQALVAAQSGDEAKSYRLLWQVLREDPEHVLCQKLLAPLPAALNSRPQRRLTTSANEFPGLGAVQRWQSRHFQVTSRASAADTQHLILELEKLYAIYSQVFYEFWAPTGIITARLADENMSWPDHKRLDVVYFADRNEYLKALGVLESSIGVSTGYYNPALQRSYFYKTEDAWQTIAHELTHQFLAEACRLLSQSGKTKSSSNSEGSQRLPIDKTAGAWCIEGIALYMESLRETNEGWTLGGVDSLRLQSARYRALRDLYWPRWNEFTRYSISDWKDNPDIATYYSHAAGLTHAFLDLHPDRSKARAAFMRQLASIYVGNPVADEILGLLGEDDETAGAQYRELMTIGDSQLESLLSNKSTISQLVLSRSRITDWHHLSAFSHLEWLDLSFSNFEADDSIVLTELHQLRRLSLEGTAVSDSSLETIAKLRQLVELDLSQCNVTDQALRHFSGHPNLEILWLSQTQISDQSIATIRAIPKLRQCDVGGSKITKEKWREFTAQHPHLKNSSP